MPARVRARHAPPAAVPAEPWAWRCRQCRRALGTVHGAALDLTVAHIRSARGEASGALHVRCVCGTVRIWNDQRPQA